MQSRAGVFVGRLDRLLMRSWFVRKPLWWGGSTHASMQMVEARGPRFVWWWGRQALKGHTRSPIDVTRACQVDPVGTVRFPFFVVESVDHITRILLPWQSLF